MSVGVGPSRRATYWSASIESSAPCSSSRTRTSGLPAAIRVSVRAISSKTAILSSAFRVAGRAAPESPLAADAQLADLAEHREEREQVAGEVGEVGARRVARGPASFERK